MNGPDHFHAAENLLGVDRSNHAPTQYDLQLAQVHATLALAAATVYAAQPDNVNDYTVTAWTHLARIPRPPVKHDAIVVPLQDSNQTTGYGWWCEACEDGSAYAMNEEAATRAALFHNNLRNEAS